MSRIIDLTLPLTEGDRGVSFEQARYLETNGWNAKTLHLYSHCGTHMDAPTHFGVNETTIDRLAPESLVGRAWLVDLSGIAPGTLIEPEPIASAVPDFGQGDSLLIRTDWSRHYGQATYRDDLPRISERLARSCADKGVRMLGVEPPSVADVNNREELTRIHRILLGGGVIIVEGLTNLDQIRTAKVTLIALPLKITGGDGAPARVIAIEDD